MAGVVNTLELFYRGTNNSLYCSVLDSSGKWSQHNIGGTLAGRPVGIVDPSGTFRIFYRGTDNSLYVRSLQKDGSWPEQSLVSILAGDPVAVIDPSNTLRIFYRGTNKQPLLAPAPIRERQVDRRNARRRSDSSLRPGQPGQRLAGVLPCDDSLYTRSLNPDGQSWSDDPPLGGILAGDPIAAPLPGTNPTIVQLFYRGADNSLYSRWSDGKGNWSKEHDIGGTLAGNPIAATLPATTTIQVFYRGTNNSLYTRWREESKDWSDEHNLGGTLAGDPVCAVPPGTASLELFYRGTDNSVYSLTRSSDGTWAEKPVGGTSFGDPIAAIVPVPVPAPVPVHS